MVELEPGRIPGRFWGNLLPIEPLCQHTPRPVVPVSPGLLLLISRSRVQHEPLTDPYSCYHSKPRRWAARIFVPLTTCSGTNCLFTRIVDASPLCTIISINFLACAAVSSPGLRNFTFPRFSMKEIHSFLMKSVAVVNAEAAPNHFINGSAFLMICLGRGWHSIFDAARKALGNSWWLKWLTAKAKASNFIHRRPMDKWLNAWFPKATLHLSVRFFVDVG